MNPQDELLEIIDLYLNNGMSGEERFAFEERMAQDESLTAKVNEVRLTNEAIYYATLAELKNTIGKDLKNITYKPSFNWKKASYISIASLLLISGVTTYLITTNTKVESVKIDNSVKEIKDSTEDKNTTVSLPNATDKKKPVEIHSIQNTETKDSIIITNTASAQKSILPEDKNLLAIEKNKSIDLENNTRSNADQMVKKSVTPELGYNKTICDKLFKIKSEASCIQKETGSIIIASDGAYEYIFHADTRVFSGSKAEFTNMPAGVYEILVTYGKECTYTKKVTVSEKWCAMNEAYSFNPDYNEKWILNYESGASGTFTIFDKSGKDIYSSSFGSGNEEWIGNGRLGTTVPVGIYIAFINYSDGRKEKVELTIVR